MLTVCAGAIVSILYTLSLAQLSMLSLRKSHWLSVTDLPALPDRRIAEEV